MNQTDQAKRARLMGVAAFTLMLGAGLMASTQYFAHLIHHNTALLGPPLLVWEGAPGGRAGVYAPWKIVGWFLEHSRTLPGPIKQSLLPTLGMGVLGFFVMGRLSADPAKKGPSTTHGSARWATDDEIRREGMTVGVLERRAALKKAGKPVKDAAAVVLAQTKKGELVLDSANTHVLITGPTGSGKGVGVVVPTLLTWSGSVVCTDLKGENYELTSAWREKFSRVIYFNPASMASARFNPLAEIPLDENTIRAVENLVGMFKTRDKDDFWETRARALITMLTLDVLYHGPMKTMGKVVDQLSRATSVIEQILGRTYPDPAVDRYCGNEARAFAKLCSGNDTKTFDSIAATAQAMLALWNDPIINEVTSSSDFALADFQFGARPVSLYLVIPPGDLKRLGPLIRLFFTMLTDRLTRSESEPGRNHRLLMLMDEFPRYGKMAKIQDALTYTRSFGVKFMIITQGINKLEEVYGREQDFIDNCHHRVFLAANDHKLARLVSDMLGKRTATKDQKGRSGRQTLLSGGKGRSVTHVEYARELMTPDELMSEAFPEDRVIVMRAGRSPYFGHRVAYYTRDDMSGKWKDQKRALPRSRQASAPEATTPPTPQADSPELATTATRDAAATADSGADQTGGGDDGTQSTYPEASSAQEDGAQEDGAQEDGARPDVDDAGDAGGGGMAPTPWDHEATALGEQGAAAPSEPRAEAGAPEPDPGAPATRVAVEGAAQGDQEVAGFDAFMLDMAEPLSPSEIREAFVDPRRADEPGADGLIGVETLGHDELVPRPTDHYAYRPGLIGDDDLLGADALPGPSPGPIWPGAYVLAQGADGAHEGAHEGAGQGAREDVARRDGDADVGAHDALFLRMLSGEEAGV